MYREVTMIELREVLRLWSEGLPKKRVAAQLGLDPKTVRRYLMVAGTAGLVTRGVAPTEEQVREVLLALHPAGGRPRGESWDRCDAERSTIERGLKSGLRLTKIRKLLRRQQVEIPYPTLHRFAVLELGFGRTASTIPVIDGEPGQEVQLDTGWVGWLTLPSIPVRRRRFRAWIFTAVRSRHRFVYPAFEETTARAIEACEAAWAFFGGIFHVLIVDYVSRHIIEEHLLRDARHPLEGPDQRFVGVLGIQRVRASHVKPPRVRQQIHREVNRRVHARDGAHDRPPVALQLSTGQRFKSHGGPAESLRSLRPDIAAQRGDPAGVAGRLDLPQRHLGVPDAIVQQRVNLGTIRIHQAAAPRVPRRCRTPGHRPTHRLRGDPEFRRDVALVDTALHECFNHQEVLLSQHTCPSGLLRPRRDIFAAVRKTSLMLFCGLSHLALTCALLERWGGKRGGAGHFVGHVTPVASSGTGRRSRCHRLGRVVVCPDGRARGRHPRTAGTAVSAHCAGAQREGSGLVAIVSIGSRQRELRFPLVTLLLEPPAALDQVRAQHRATMPVSARRERPELQRLTCTQGRLALALFTVTQNGDKNDLPTSP